MNNIKFLKTSFLASALLLAFSAEAYHVDVTPSTKHILLEESTGIECTSCPGIEPYIAKFKANYPDANMIAIHGYHFKNKTFDLSTPGGDEIIDEFDVVSYPQGSFNRVLFDGFTRWYVSKEFWDRLLPLISDQTAPVNLWMRSWMDKETRIVTIELEGYILEDIGALDPHVTVVMTQDGIIAPQKGQKEENYTHNNVLRDFITPTWGEPVSETSVESYFTKTWQYELPEEIGVFSVVPEDVKFIAFVTEGKVNCMNSISSSITFGKPSDEEKPSDETPSVTLEKSRYEISPNYGFNFIEVYLENPLEDAVSTATFEVELNGVSSEVTWNGEILPGQSCLVQVPTGWFEDPFDSRLEESNTFSVRCLSLNDTEVLCEPIEGTFRMPHECAKELNISITVDAYTAEATIVIKDADGNIVNYLAPFEGSDHYATTIKLDPLKVYCIETTASSDVMPLAESEAGTISVYDVRMDSPVIENQSLAYNSRYFIHTSLAAAGIGTTGVSETACTVYDLEGRIVLRADAGAPDLTSLPRGIYIIRQGATATKIIR